MLTELPSSAAALSMRVEQHRLGPHVALVDAAARVAYMRGLVARERAPTVNYSGEISRRNDARSLIHAVG